jgi:hypothetical protein
VHLIIKLATIATTQIVITRVILPITIITSPSLTKREALTISRRDILGIFYLGRLSAKIKIILLSVVAKASNYLN